MFKRNLVSSVSVLVSLPFATFACSDFADSSRSDDPSVARVTSALVGDDVVASVELLGVQIPDAFNVPYSGAASAEFPSGLPLSIGSGLRAERHGPDLCGCAGGNQRREYTLTGLSDRGPNGDAPTYRDASGVSHPSKSYAVPSFTPQLVTIRVGATSGARVTRTVPLRVNHVRVTGLPPASLTPEVGLSEGLVALPADEGGVDPEGVDFDSRGNAWLCDEYGPSLLRVTPGSGAIRQRLSPGAGLPPVLASRQVNRGFEGVAVAPNGKVYAQVQSTLDVDGKTKGTAQFLRLVEYDPNTSATRMLAYLHDVSSYKKSSDAKMGDLFAIDDGRFLELEQGKDKDGNLRNLVYEIDIRGATDLTGITLATGNNAGKELEYGTLAEVLAQVTPVTKTLLVDLRAYGFLPEKAEGMTLVDDRTLVIANDQDFGVTAKIAGDATSTDPTRYVVDSTGALSIDGIASPGTYEIHALGADAQRSELFIVHLQESLARDCPP